MQIVYTIDGQDYTLEDLTLNELRAIERETGMQWGSFDPIRSADAYASLLVALLSRSVPRADAEVRVGKMTMREVNETFRLVDEDEPGATNDRPTELEEGLPKAVADPSTGS